jgi:hypothetical protein
MSRTNATLNSINGTSTLARAKFSAGMLLQHEDLEQLNIYTRDLSRLLFRSFFGCGVVCGLVVSKPEPDPCGKLSITVAKGLALDCSGDPIYVPKDLPLALDEKCEGELPSQLWVILCGTTKCCAPRTSACASDEEESSSVCTRERFGFEIRIVRELPKCICSCRTEEEYESDHESECFCVDPNHPCYRDHYQGKCDCNAGEDCGCCCECVLLAQLDKNEEEWTVDHSVRRFVRPVLMRDPEVEAEREAARQRNQQALIKQQQQQLAKKTEKQLATERQQRREQELVKEEKRLQRERAASAKAAKAAKTTQTTKL